MDKKVANQIVSDTLNASFDKEAFVYFIKNLLNHTKEAPFVYRGNLIPDAYDKHISTLERIGKYDDGENRIDILIVNLKKETSIERARTMQRNFIAWYLNGSRGGEMKDAALVAFVSPDQEDWRFSLVKMDYKFEEKKDGRVKVKEVFTPARRWSFLVGKNENSHTAKSRLAPIVCDDEHNPTLKDLEYAFNIEKVTKEFFEKYRELFLWAKESFDKIFKEENSVKKDFEDKGINTVDFTKKLLGQIVFLYFLQKKGWFGVERDANWGTGPKNFLRELFESKHSKYKNFFNDILEPLFYEALAREREDSFYSRFNCKIPFLNGGLFDPINNYDWVHTDILLPNELFSNHYKTKEGDEGNGILDIFDRYNFTVKEDEPLEKEVAVDPEMLGKVFENLLEVKDRKSKGTYYTPREIVHYMCEQSLLNYLATELAGKVEKDEVEQLIKYGESVIENETRIELKGKETKKYKYKLPESIRKNAKLIDEKLADIKVCDPAVGSGAFPVGMMAEIVKARSVLSAYIKDKDRTIYDFKRQCIQNSLYGVDIDPGAVEIAKLRLWLSLVVDEDDIKTIRPLPNLDYKIMQGNSLLEEFEGVKLFDERLLGSPIINAELFEPNNQKIIKVQSDLLRHYMANPAWMKNKDLERPQEVRNLEAQLLELLRNKKMIKETGYEQKDLFAEVAESREIRDELERLHKKFFEETSKNRKDELKQHIGRLDWDLIEITLKEQKKTSAIKKIEEFKQSNTKPFFLWKLNFADVFEKKGGFDLVIANPPYIRIFKQNQNDNTKEAIKRIYKSAYKDFDYYVLFIEKGLDILKPDGILTYITPDKYLVREYGAKIRGIIFNYSIKELFDLSRATDIFNAATYPLISIIQKNKQETIIKVKIARTIQNLEHNFKELSLLKQLCVDNDRIEIIDPELNVLITKILSQGKRLSEILNPSQIFCGTPRAKDYHLWSKYISAKKSKDSLRVLVCSNLSPYVINHDKKVRVTGLSISTPYFSNNKKIISENRWHNFSFVPKILIRGNDTRITAVLDQEGSVFIGIYGIKIEKNIIQDSKILLACLNSSLYQWIFNIQNPSIKIGGEFFSINSPHILRLPFKSPTSGQREGFNKIFDKILVITKTKDYLVNSIKQAKVKEYERQIDKMVYKLYGLTPEEIKIVENNK